jgi:hypothetical protein
MILEDAHEILRASGQLVPIASYEEAAGILASQGLESHSIMRRVEAEGLEEVERALKSMKGESSV